MLTCDAGHVFTLTGGKPTTYARQASRDTPRASLSSKRASGLTPAIYKEGEMVLELATIGEAVAIVAACWAIISGIGAWKREFIGKRKIELAEEMLARFLEMNDAVAFIRNPFSSSNEGRTRERSEHENPEHSELLDRLADRLNS